jgi:hypothetical protein
LGCYHFAATPQLPPKHHEKGCNIKTLFY